MNIEKEILYNALHSEFGVKVSTNDPKLFMQRLYAERKKTKEFESLSFKVSPENPESEVVILKG